MNPQELYEIVCSQHKEVREELKEIKNLIKSSNDEMHKTKTEVAVTKSRVKILFILMFMVFSVIGYVIKSLIITT